jgi:hypothetical protein
MTYVSVDVHLDEFSDQELIDEMRLRDLHVFDAKELYDIYATKGKEAFFKAAKKFVEEQTGRIMV